MLKYICLRNEINEIRLLEILPRENARTDSFRLHNVPLNAAPPFWAISYTWNNNQPTSDIVINRRTKAVRQNLQEILTHLVTFLEDVRRAGLHSQTPLWAVRFIWVDAICINQDNHAERIHQIRLMGQIFKNGKVACCLGSEDWDLDRVAFHFLFDTGRPEQQSSAPEIDNDTALALLRFFDKRWFKRTWTVQEFVYADKDGLFWMAYRPVYFFPLWLAANRLYNSNFTGLDDDQTIQLKTGIKEFMTLHDVHLELKMGGDPGYPLDLP